MSAPIWLFYNGLGMLALGIFIGGYTVAHLLGLLRWGTAQFCAKLLGLGGLISLFIASGWKGGLCGLGLGIAFASVTLWLSQPGRVRADSHYDANHYTSAADFPIPSPVKRPTPAYRLFG
jgi:hypothetical protein